MTESSTSIRYSNAALLLTRAAEFLEGQGKIADQGPWRVTPLPATCAIHTGEGSPYPGDHVANVGNRYSAAWIATFSPSVATPLVAWLRAEARFVHRNIKHMHGDVEHLPSVLFARQVLGETP